MLTWTKYGISKFATFVSVIAAFVRYAGILALVLGGEIIAGIILIAVGLGLHFCAEAIARNKAEKYINAASIEESDTEQ